MMTATETYAVMVDTANAQRRRLRGDEAPAVSANLLYGFGHVKALGRFW
jgi:hypothetical protein